jgi:pentose-5-phosphate-3-epimerase
MPSSEEPYNPPWAIQLTIINNPHTPIERAMSVFRAISSENDKFNVLVRIEDENLINKMWVHNIGSKIAIAMNPFTPQEILVHLAHKHDTAFAVAKNPSAPVDALDDLSKSVDKHIKMAVANNSNTISTTLVDLYNDRDSEVSRVAGRILRMNHPYALGVT